MNHGRSKHVVRSVRDRRGPADGGGRGLGAHSPAQMIRAWVVCPGRAEALRSDKRVLYFLLGLLHPDEVGSDFDMQRHFEDVRAWFFGVFLGLGVLDGVDSALKISSGVSDLEGRLLVEYSVFLGVWIIGAAILLRVRGQAVAGFVGAIYLLFAIRMALVTPGLGSVLPGQSLP